MKIELDPKGIRAVAILWAIIVGAAVLALVSPVVLIVLIGVGILVALLLLVSHAVYESFRDEPKDYF